LTIEGTLDAQGLATTSNIFITSLRDDRNGDTNGNGSTTSPQAGDWKGIIINPGGTATILNVTALYGGASSSAIFTNNGGILDISSSTIDYSANYGVNNVAGTTTIARSDISLNDEGVHISGGDIEITPGNIIRNNSSFGIYNELSTTFDARYNYWGTSTGPYHYSTNTSGTGNAVSDYINYDPWIHILNNTHAYSSVVDGQIHWNGTTTYSTAFNDSVAAWNSLSRVNIVPASGTAEVTISDFTNEDYPYVAYWKPLPSVPDELKMNNYHMTQTSAAEKQNIITHELGHALGLEHSYLGNIMYLFAGTQTALGPQDLDDYYSLWP
jgi:hypothetical protein